MGRYRQIFGPGPFRLFWGGFTFSSLGDSMTRVALVWYVYELTHSARAVGGLLLCYTGPIIVGGLVAGVLHLFAVGALHGPLHFFNDVLVRRPNARPVFGAPS